MLKTSPSDSPSQRSVASKRCSNRSLGGDKVALIFSGSGASVGAVFAATGGPGCGAASGWRGCGIATGSAGGAGGLLSTGGVVGTSATAAGRAGSEDTLAPVAVPY